MNFLEYRMRRKSGANLFRALTPTLASIGHWSHRAKVGWVGLQRPVPSAEEPIPSLLVQEAFPCILEAIPSQQEPTPSLRKPMPALQ